MHCICLARVSCMAEIVHIIHHSGNILELWTWCAPTFEQIAPQLPHNFMGSYPETLLTFLHSVLWELRWVCVPSLELIALQLVELLSGNRFDLFALSDLKIQDGHLKIDRCLVGAEVSLRTKFGVDSPATCGVIVQKPFWPFCSQWPQNSRWPPENR